MWTHIHEERARLCKGRVHFGGLFQGGGLATMSFIPPAKPLHMAAALASHRWEILDAASEARFDDSLRNTMRYRY